MLSRKETEQKVLIMSYPGYHAGQVDITHGLAGPATFPRHHGGADAAEAAALAAIRSTPQYHQLVNQYRYHMAGQNGGAPPARPRTPAPPAATADPVQPTAAPPT